MVAGNTARDAQLAQQHGKRMARVEILFDKLDQQLPTLVRCVEVCSEFGPTAEAAASTHANIRDQTATTTQTVSQRLDGMEETIRDTFLDLKVDVISTTLALLERNIATHFTAVDAALMQMASSPHAGVGPDGPPLRETPPTQAAVPDPSRMDTAIPGLARPTSADKAPHPGCFQAETTFQPGSAFPASNQFSHMKDGGPPHADSNHRQQMADDSDDAGVWTAWRPDSAIPANRFQHYRDMGVPHEQAHHQPQ